MQLLSVVSTCWLKLYFSPNPLFITSDNCDLLKKIPVFSIWKTSLLEEEEENSIQRLDLKFISIWIKKQLKEIHYYQLKIHIQINTITNNKSLCKEGYIRFSYRSLAMLKKPPVIPQLEFQVFITWGRIFNPPLGNEFKRHRWVKGGAYFLSLSL